MRIRRPGAVATLALVAFATLTIALVAPVLSAPVGAQQPSTADLLLAADGDLAAGRYAAAASAYRDVLTTSVVHREDAWTGLVRALAAEGDYAAAALHTRLLLRHDPAEPDRVRYLGAVASRDAGDPDAAARGFRAVQQAAGELAPIAHLRLAQALAAASRNVEASAAFRATAADPRTPAPLRTVALLEGADAALALGGTDRALALLDAAAADRNAAPSDVSAARWRATALRRDAGDPRWTDDAGAAIAAAPSSAEATSALDTLNAAGVPVSPLLAGYVRYRAREDDDARALYRRVADAPASDSDAATAHFYLGAIEERAPDPEAAIAAYRASIDAAPTGPLADDALWWRALLLEEAGRHLDAAADLDRLTTVFPGSPFARDAAIRGPLARARGGDLPAARSQLRRLVDGGGGDSAARAARWLAVLAEPGAASPSPAGYDPTSIATLLDLAGPAATDPLPAAALEEWSASATDWAEAQRWLDATFGPPAADATAPAADGRLALGLALAAVDEHAVARTALRGLLGDYRGQPHALLELARTASAAGLHDTALIAATSLLSPLSPIARLSTPLSIEQLAYPAPYGRSVLDAAASESIPPLLLLALTRQESAFNPQAVSAAAARGLTQVIAPTGEAIAASLGVPWDPADLSRPERSLRFGAHYLATQLEQFDGNVLAALAAYNGGPFNARRWLERQWWPGADGYIHAVEFAETRRYLERVLENYAWYRYLYGGASAPALRAP